MQEKNSQFTAGLEESDRVGTSPLVRLSSEANWVESIFFGSFGNPREGALLEAFNFSRIPSPLTDIFWSVSDPIEIESVLEPCEGIGGRVNLQVVMY